MAELIVGAAYYGARFEAAAPREIRVFFRPSSFSTLGPGETAETYTVFIGEDPIRVGTVGRRSSADDPWTFRESYSPQQTIPPVNLSAFLLFRQFQSAPDYPFFSLDGAPLEWYTKTYSRFLGGGGGGAKVLMPDLVTASSSLREIITGFTVDTSGAAPVVSSVTKERVAEISLHVAEFGTGHFIQAEDPAKVAECDGGIFGTIEFKKLYNTSFTYTEGTGPVAGVLRDFTRKFSFAAMAEPPSF